MTLAYGLLVGLLDGVRKDTATAASEMKALEWVVTMVILPFQSITSCQCRVLTSMSLFQLNILLIVMPYIFSILEIGISTLRVALCNKEKDIDSKFAFVPPEANITAGSTTRGSVAQVIQPRNSDRERSSFQRVDSMDNVDLLQVDVPRRSPSGYAQSRVEIDMNAIHSEEVRHQLASLIARFRSQGLLQGNQNMSASLGHMVPAELEPESTTLGPRAEEHH